MGDCWRSCPRYGLGAAVDGRGDEGRFGAERGTLGALGLCVRVLCWRSTGGHGHPVVGQRAIRLPVSRRERRVHALLGATGLRPNASPVSSGGLTIDSASCAASGIGPKGTLSPSPYSWSWHSGPPPPPFSKATSSASPTAIHPRCSTPSRSSTASASPEPTRPRRVRPFAFALARTWRVLLSATPLRSADTRGTATGGWPARSGWPRPTPAAGTVPARRRWKPASRKLRSGSAGTTGSTWASRAPRTGSGTPSRKGRRGRG